MNNKPKVKKISSCRVCKGKDLVKVFGLGPTPLANAFLTKNQIDLEEEFYPLDVYFCNNCSFIELGHVVSRDLLFGNYVYVSSTSQVFIDHFKNFAQSVFKKFTLNSDSLVIDIGSNDGIFLIPFKKLSARVLGIEPAIKIAKVARKEGIETMPYYFSLPLARKIVKQKGKAKVVTATNVFAHIDNLDEVISGLQVLLDRDGVFIMEAPYLVDFLEKRYFDLVYHEHLSYWSIKSLVVLFKRFDMEVFDVQKVAAHGGTIRVFISKKGAYKKEKSVEKFLILEKKWKLEKKETYLQFSDKVLDNKIKLLDLLRKIKSENKKIVGYGAPAKGNTLLNFFSIGTETLDYIIDNSSWKQGLYSPGKRIPVVSPEVFKKDKVDYILILAWNFAESIMENNSQFSKKGGRFIIPVPKPVII